MTAASPDPERNGASTPPPGPGTPPALPAVDHPLAVAEPPDAGQRLTPAQQEAIAKVTALAAARGPATERGLSRAATITIVALGVLIFSMVLLAALVS